MEEAEVDALWRDAMGRRMDGFESRLDDNTAATKRVENNTQAIVDAFESWQGAMKVLDFIGRMAKPLAAIVALVAAWFTFKGAK
jgi:hypothetical protein